MVYDNLTKENYIFLAMRRYDSPNLLMSEFEEDFKHIKYIKKLLQKYRTVGILKERLILNHIICLANVFDVEFATRLLFFRINEEDYDVLKTFLLALDYLPDIVRGIDGRDIKTDLIPVNMSVAKVLRSELSMY